VAEGLAVIEEQATTRRPVPVSAAPAMKNLRNDLWLARAPTARNEELIHLGRPARANGFVSRQQFAHRPMHGLMTAMPA